MPKLSIFLFLSVFFINHLSAQDKSKVQWASELISFSSEFSPNINSAKQALGPPSVFPDKGSTPCAWTVVNIKSEKDDYIEVAFAEAQHVQQIFIAEPMNPGAVFEIYLYSTDSKKYKVFQQVPKPIMPKDKGGRLFNVKIDRTPYAVSKLRLVIMGQNVPGHNLIDAIGVADDTLPYEIRIETIENADMVGQPENLGEGVNSTGAELAPQISPDGQFLFFTRQYHPENIGNSQTQDVWFAQSSGDGIFGKAQNIGEPINNARNNALCAVTPDGQTLVLMNKYFPDGQMENGVSMSHRTSNGWSFPVALEIKNFYNEAKTGEYFLGADAKTILMTVKRSESIGEKDIFVSFKNQDGTWTEPLNLGPDINTADSEISPYLASDGKTIYFSTAGYPGYGSADMFMSRRLDSSWTKWSKPLNLGPKLNTTGFDAYYSVPASGDYAYFSSTGNGSVGRNDIFRAKLPESARPEPVVLIKGVVFNAKTNEPLEAAVRIESLKDGKELGIAKSNPTTGAYSIVLPAGLAYGFLAEKQRFLSKSENLDLTDIKTYKEIKVDLFLTPLEEGASIRLNNIFFDYNKFNIKSENFPELNRVVEMLNQYPNMQIEISGHTDNIGSDQINLQLSNNRAGAVTDYLVNKGIVKSRIKSVGKGKLQPVADNSNEEGRALNRRIEMKIIKLE
jgi:OmpA-OmpF porin, OOP family